LLNWGIPLIHVFLVESSLILWFTKLVRGTNCGPSSTLRLWRIIFPTENVVGHVTTGRLMNCYWCLCWPLRITRAHLPFCILLGLSLFGILLASSIWLWACLAALRILVTLLSWLLVLRLVLLLLLLLTETCSWLSNFRKCLRLIPPQANACCPAYKLKESSI
jgi:hypothetical protein